MSYDQGYWHTDSCAERGIDEKYAGTHIAIYVKWCLERGFLIEEIVDKKFASQDSNARGAVRLGRMSASEYFERFLDWKLGEWNLTQDGNEFTKSYYKKYLEDLNDKFPDVIVADESLVKWKGIFDLLDNRLAEFRELDADHVSWKKKPFWKFW